MNYIFKLIYIDIIIMGVRGMIFFYGFMNLGENLDYLGNLEEYVNWNIIDF